jgi:hypothetical protein
VSRGMTGRIPTSGVPPPSSASLWVSWASTKPPQGTTKIHYILYILQWLATHIYTEI